MLCVLLVFSATRSNTYCTFYVFLVRDYIILVPPDYWYVTLECVFLKMSISRNFYLFWSKSLSKKVKKFKMWKNSKISIFLPSLSGTAMNGRLYKFCQVYNFLKIKILDIKTGFKIENPEKIDFEDPRSARGLGSRGFDSPRGKSFLPFEGKKNCLKFFLGWKICWKFTKKPEYVYLPSCEGSLFGLPRRKCKAQT